MMRLSNENVKWYFRETSYNGWSTMWCHLQQLCLLSWRGFASLQSAHNLNSANSSYKIANNGISKTVKRATVRLA